MTIASTFVLFVVRNNQIIEDANVLTISLVQVLLLGLGLGLLLALFSKKERWTQSATALYGCSAMVLIAVLPFLMMSPGIDMTVASLTTVVIVATSFWYFAIIVFVLKESLEISLIFAFVVSLVLELAFATVLLQLFGDKAH
jgi:hypothetical protein